MNNLLKTLSGGNLQSDGRANEVAHKVIAQPQLLNQLIEGLSEFDDVIRARTAHVLERICRTHSEMLLGLLPQFIELAVRDEVPMVKWHLAMIFGNLTVSDDTIDVIISTLFRMLKDKSAFVKGWSIVSLTILGRKKRAWRGRIIGKIKPLQDDESIAVRSKVMKAVTVLENDNEPIPTGWAKARDSSCL